MKCSRHNSLLTYNYLLVLQLLHHRNNVRLFQIFFVWLRYAPNQFVGWGFAPDPIGGAYSAPPDPVAGLGMGPLGKRRREGRGKGGRGGVWKVGDGVPECPNS